MICSWTIRTHCTLSVYYCSWVPVTSTVSQPFLLKPEIAVHSEPNSAHVAVLAWAPFVIVCTVGTLPRLRGFGPLPRRQRRLDNGE